MFSNRLKKSKESVLLGLDLGSTEVKAAVVSRESDGFKLVEYATRPVSVPAFKPEHQAAFAQEVSELMAGLKTTERRACVTISSSSAIVCHTEFPRMPLDEVRNILKLNSAKYLRRDFSNYFLDAAEVILDADNAEAKKNPKMQILVGGASREEVTWFRDALAVAKVRPMAVELSAISVVNAFQKNYPDVCREKAVLLVDIGARSTSISFLRSGVPVITRIMRFGGQQITDYLAQILTLELAHAEEEKRNMSEPVQALVKTALSPLAREVRSSIDFFERQNDCHVGRAFACGGTAQSQHVLDFLSEEVGLRIECCNPVGKLEIAHFNGESDRLIAAGPGLAAAIGAALGRL